MLPLDNTLWSELEHAYGKADDIPSLLLMLADLPDSAGESEPWFTLWSSLAHQGDVYSASFAAVPHVINALASAPERASAVYFQFPAWVEICRVKNGTPIPTELGEAYFAALKKLPFLVASASDREWDEGFLTITLSAIAASKGYASVAEASLELTPSVANDFVQWFFER